jgi:hypothetical protein
MWFFWLSKDCGEKWKMKRRGNWREKDEFG